MWVHSELWDAPIYQNKEEEKKHYEKGMQLQRVRQYLMVFWWIVLFDQVDDMTADFIISQLLFLDAEDSKKDIKLFINSPGGSVTAGMLTKFYSLFLHDYF